MKRLPSLLCVLVLSALAACRADPPQAPDATPAGPPPDTSPPEAPDTTAPTPSPDVVAPPTDATPPALDPGPRLLEPGAEPRRALTYAAAAGFEQRLPVTMAVGLKTEVDGQVIAPSLPKVALTLSAKVESRDGDALSIALAALESRVEGEPTTAAGKRLAEVIAGLSGVSGNKSMDAGGRTKAVNFTRPKDLPAAVAPVVEGFEQALDHMLVPLPRDPIGTGARWQTTQVITQGGVTLVQTTTWTLEAIQGSRLTLAMQVALAPRDPASPQSTTLPGGLLATLERVDGDGKGRLVMDLARLLPVELAVENRVTLGLALADPAGKPKSMKVEMTLDLATPAPSP